MALPCSCNSKTKKGKDLKDGGISVGLLVQDVKIKAFGSTESYRTVKCWFSRKSYGAVKLDVFCDAGGTFEVAIRAFKSIRENVAHF